MIVFKLSFYLLLEIWSKFIFDLEVIRLRLCLIWCCVHQLMQSPGLCSPFLIFFKFAEPHFAKCYIENLENICATIVVVVVLNKSQAKSTQEWSIRTLVMAWSTIQISTGVW
jgi:hypothetical protein